jgi:hypothetical protein
MKGRRHRNPNPAQRVAIAQNASNTHPNCTGRTPLNHSTVMSRKATEIALPTVSTLDLIPNHRLPVRRFIRRYTALGLTKAIPSDNQHRISTNVPISDASPRCVLPGHVV